MLLKAGAISLALLLASRVLGLLRESAQAAAFGTSGLGDVAVLMLTLPDWLASLLAGGALGYVLLPYWAAQAPGSHARSQRKIAIRLLFSGCALAFCLWLARGPVTALLAPGLPAGFERDAASALGWSALSVPLALLAVLWATRLQHERDFAGMYAGNLVVNAILVVALLGLASVPQVTAPSTYLGAALLAAMLARLAWFGWRQRLPEPAELPVGADAAGAALPSTAIWCWAVLSSGLPLAMPFIARTMASQAGEGELATFNYAWKLVELPLVLAIQLAASLSFPAIAAAFRDETTVAGDARANIVRQAFAVTFTLGCSAAAALLVGAPAVAQLLFGWGRMTPASIERLASWAATGAFSLLPQAVIAVALTILAARGQMKAAVLAYGAALLLLVLSDHWAGGDGGRLMLVLDVLLLAVAVLCIAALGRHRGWLPWRAMLAPLAVVAAAAALRHAGVLQAAAPGMVGGLILAALAAGTALGVAVLASTDLRRLLQR